MLKLSSGGGGDKQRAKRDVTWSLLNFKLGVLPSSRVTIANMKVSLRKCASDSSSRPAVLVDRHWRHISQGVSSPLVPTAWRPSNHRGPTPSSSCLFVYSTSHMRVSVVVSCASDSHRLVCVCSTGLEFRWLLLLPALLFCFPSHLLVWGVSALMHFFSPSPSKLSSCAEWPTL